MAITHPNTALGDSASFDAAYRELYPLALRAADRVLHDRAAAEDVAQDVFMDLWRGRSSYDGSRGSLRGYVSMLARSRALDRWRTRSARDAAAGRLEQEVAVGASAEEGPEDVALRHDRVEYTVQALAAIPAPQREAVLLAYAGGLSANGVADAAGIPLGTAKSRIRGGLSKLRVQLESSPGFAGRSFAHHS